MLLNSFLRFLFGFKDAMFRIVTLLRAGLDLESGLKNGLGWKKSTPLIGREVGTRLFKFTP